MADESVSILKAQMGYAEALERARTLARAKSSHEPREKDAMERITARCRGLRATMVLASCEMEKDDLSGHVWQELFYFIQHVVDDIEGDAELLWREGRVLWDEGVEAGRNDSKAA